MKIKTSISSLILLLTCSLSVKAQDVDSESLNKGKTLYDSNCTICHMANGEGVSNAFPPLAKSDYLMEDKDRSIKVILEGASGQMKVNSVNYYGAMIGYANLSNQEIADIINYIRNSWGNKGEILAPNDIEKIRN